jgi:hypothetical protein
VVQQFEQGAGRGTRLWHLTFSVRYRGAIRKRQALIGDVTARGCYNRRRIYRYKVCPW